VPRLADVSDLMEHLDVQGDEALLERLLDAAEVVAERYARRRFSPDPVDTTGPGIPKTFALTRNKSSLRVPDLRVVTSIVIDGALISDDDYRLSYGASTEPATHIYLRSGSYLYSWNGYADARITITGHWGFNPTPPDVIHAVLSSAARAYRMRDASYGDSVVVEGGGNLNYVRQLSEEAKAILDSYRVPNFAFA